MAEHDVWLEELAGAILDGTPVDWASVEASAGLARRELLDQLRFVAMLADCRRSTESEDAPADAPASSAEFESPGIIDGRYSLEQPLGEGGMGLVYRARHLELNKIFALKLLQPQRRLTPDAVMRFRMEAHALGCLDHQNIVRVTDFGIDSRAGPYLVMECVEGQSLREYISSRTPLPVDEALPIVRGIAAALDHAHDAGILHRDLKPSNVLLARRADGRRDVKLVDFGIASLREPVTLDAVSAEVESLRLVTEATNRYGAQRPQTSASDGSGPPFPPVRLRSNLPGHQLTAPGVVVGTLDYIAPEVLAGQRASTSADIYALGVVIYEMLTGRHPSYASLEEPPESHVDWSLPWPSTVCASVPADLDQAILRPMNSDPHARPSRARDVVAELRHATHRTRVRQWRRIQRPRRMALSIAAATLVLLLYAPVRGSSAVHALENMVLDVRVSLQPLRPPDPRIVLISIDDAALAADATPLTARADEVGTRLEQVFEAGARGVAIDLLLPEEWSRSEAFSRLILNHADRVVLASYSGNEGSATGPESVQGLVTVALGRERIERLFGFVNLSADADGVVRTMPVSYRDRDGKAVPSLAARVAETASAGSLGKASTGPHVWIDYSIEWTKFQRVSWSELPAILAANPEMFRDRVVLLGGEFAGSGDVFKANRHDESLPQEISGLLLQALTLNTLLAGGAIRPWNEPVGVALLAGASALAVMAILYLPTSGQAIGAVAAGAMLYFVVSILLFRWSHQWVPVVAPGVVVGVAILCATVLRRLLLPFPTLAPEEPQ